MFLHVCVILFTGRGEYLGRYTPQDQVHPPGAGTPLGTRYTPRDQVHPLGQATPPGTRYTPQDQVHPPGPGTPLGTRYTPWDQVHPPGTRYTPLGADTPPGPDRLRHTVNERPVRILLECILVLYWSSQTFLVPVCLSG